METLLVTVVYGGMLLLILQKIFDVAGLCANFFSREKLGNKKPMPHSPAYEMNRHSTAVIMLLEAIENERIMLPRSNGLSGVMEGDPNIYGNQQLDYLARFVRNDWKQEHFEVFRKKLDAGEKVEAYVLNFLTQTSADILEGDPVLNHDKTGAALTLFEHSIQRCVSLGIYTDHWANENLRKPVNERRLI